jgi:hypothetical protein
MMRRHDWCAGNGDHRCCLGRLEPLQSLLSDDHETIQSGGAVAVSQQVKTFPW